MTESTWYLGKYPPTLIEAIATHSLLSALGYSTADNLFMSISEKDVEVLLRAEGKQVALRMGTPEVPPLELAKLWRQLIGEWNTGGTISNEEKSIMCNGTKIFVNKMEITAKLLLAGFRLPITQNAQPPKTH